MSMKEKFLPEACNINDQDEIDDLALELESHKTIADKTRNLKYLKELVYVAYIIQTTQYPIGEIVTP